MPTGPEHYRQAERCLSSVEDDSDLSMALLAEAQVHATLALAAAKAVADGDWMPSQDSAAWREAAASEEPAQ